VSRSFAWDFPGDTISSQQKSFCGKTAAHTQTWLVILFESKRHIVQDKGGTTFLTSPNHKKLPLSKTTHIDFLLPCLQSDFSIYNRFHSDYSGARLILFGNCGKLMQKIDQVWCPE